MANWNIKKKNGQNVMFNDNPRTRTTENKTFRHDVIEHRMNPEDLQKMMRMDEESIKEDQKKERIVMLICFFLLPPLFIVVLILKICGLLSYK